LYSLGVKYLNPLSVGLVKLVITTVLTGKFNPTANVSVAKTNFINLFLIVYFQLNSTDAVLIFIVCFLVLIAEIINTAIEKICDFIKPHFNEKIGLIKDLAAASVVTATLLSLITGVLVYSKYVF